MNQQVELLMLDHDAMSAEGQKGSSALQAKSKPKNVLSRYKVRNKVVMIWLIINEREVILQTDFLNPFNKKKKCPSEKIA